MKAEMEGIFNENIEALKVFVFIDIYHLLDVLNTVSIPFDIKLLFLLI
jgi:hypothetical protein